MTDYLFYGKIDHNEHTIEELFKCQYYTYKKGKIITRLATGFVMVLIAVVLDLPMWAKGILLLFGAWFLVSKSFRAEIRADRAVEARHGALPKMQYKFFEESFRVTGEGSTELKYTKIERLVEDKQYLYVFMGADSVCMIERDSIKPQDTEHFMKFLTEKTNLQWQKDKGILSMTLWDVVNMMKEKRGN